MCWAVVCRQAATRMSTVKHGIHGQTPVPLEGVPGGYVWRAFTRRDDPPVTKGKVAAKSLANTADVRGLADPDDRHSSRAGYDGQ